MLSDQQKQAAQMKAQGKADVAIANKIGVARSTIARWKNNEEWQRLVEDYRAGRVKDDDKKSDAEILRLTKEQIKGYLQRGEKPPRELTMILQSLNRKVGKKKKTNTLLDGLGFEDEQDKFRPREFEHRRASIEHWMRQDKKLRAKIEACIAEHQDLQERRECVVKAFNGGLSDEEVLDKLTQRLVKHWNRHNPDNQATTPREAFEKWVAQQKEKQPDEQPDNNNLH